MKYFLISGEASGDLHASNLIRALRTRDAQATFVGLGGDKMRAEGCDIRVDYRDMAYMGILAVLQNLGKIQRNFRIAKLSLLNEQPDVLILIDYPSFNLRMAKFCKQHLPNTRIVYYIPPKIWAWKKWRVHTIAKYCDEILGIFPFEPDFYAKYGYRCHYVGNPTADSIREFASTHSTLNTKHSTSYIALLPGSRRSEISHCLPTMLQAARLVAQNNYQIIVTAAPGIEDDFYHPFLQQGETLTRDTYNTVAQAKAAVVNSGTATLETALIGCPQTAVYHVTGSKYLEKILRPIIFTIPHFTLVNIIPSYTTPHNPTPSYTTLHNPTQPYTTLNNPTQPYTTPAIQELIASRFTVENVTHELNRLLHDEPYRQTMLSNYQHLWHILGSQSAADTAADIITHL
jgi:lipid-A-disaccharide synthase